MKVLHITTNDRDGAGLCCFRIHQALLDLGVDSKVITLRNHQHFNEEYDYGYWKYKLSLIPSKICRLLGFELTEKNKLLKLINEKGAAYSIPKSSVNLLKCRWVMWADIVHLHWVSNYLDYTSFFHKIDKPVVWTLHDEYFFYGIAHYSNTLLPDNVLEIKYAKLKRDAIVGVKDLVVVFLSDFFENKFKKNDLLYGRKVRVVNNPVDTSLFQIYSKKEARKKLCLKDDDIVFGFTALTITDERKGLDVLSKALIELKDPRLKILAIGSNPRKEVWPNVISIGLIEDSKSIGMALSAADYFAMPSYQEAFAQSPMEAMSCGLPVVAFPVSGTSELINYNNGVVCEDFTLGAMVRGISLLMSRKYDSNMIRQDMINRFSPLSIAKKYIRIYKEII